MGLLIIGLLLLLVGAALHHYGYGLVGLIVGGLGVILLIVFVLALVEDEDAKAVGLAMAMPSSGLKKVLADEQRSNERAKVIKTMTKSIRKRRLKKPVRY